MTMEADELELLELPEVIEALGLELDLELELGPEVLD